MPATSLKLPDDLKRRIDALITKTEQSAHAFMIEAIRREIEREEKRRAFLDDARESEEEARRSVKAFDAQDAFTYLAAKVEGKKVRRPRARKWPPSA